MKSSVNHIITTIQKSRNLITCKFGYYLATKLQWLCGQSTYRLLKPLNPGIQCSLPNGVVCHSN